MGSVEQFQNTVWEELGQPSSPSLISIQGWAISNIGKLSIDLDNQYIVKSGAEFYPEFTTEVSGIYQELYNIKFYEKNIRIGLDGVNLIPQNQSGDIIWTEMQEGDSRIKRVNPTEVLKTYKQLLDYAKNNYSELIFNYKLNASKPRQTTGDDDIITRSRWNS